MQFMFFMVWLFMFAVGLSFLFRILSALFSDAAAQGIQQRPILHAFWALPGIFSALVLFFFLFPQLINVWPPHWLELKHQREKVLKRVQATGGWERLKNDCLIFAKTNQEHGVFWIGRTTNHVALPSAIEGLKPQEIRFDPGSISANDKFYYPVIHLKIFGMHSTGGHSTPYYGLDVICGKESTSHQPAPYASGNSHYHYRKIADSIYEVY